jgi:hypothetical protein
MGNYELQGNKRLRDRASRKSMPLAFQKALAFTASTLILILMVHPNRDLMLAKYFDPEEKFKFMLTISDIGQTKPIHAVELNRQNMRDPKFWFVVAGLPSPLGFSHP